jgi:isopenicillin N synthase-like dioxygenase
MVTNRPEPTVVVPRISLKASDAARQLDAAASTLGFFQVFDHDVPADVIDHMRAVTDLFFSLPLADKMQCRPTSPEINRGYAAKGTEGLSYSLGIESPPDLFEAFNLGPDNVDETKPWADTLFFAKNIWPSRQLQGESFRQAVVDYYAHVERLAHQLTDLFADALGLPARYFGTYTDHSTDTLRINHYQRAAVEGEPLSGQLGMGPHTDYGIVTVLYADAVPGLQILANATIENDASGGQQWIDVSPDPDCFLVNLGDLTAQWTNDRWKSTLHRVLPPKPGQKRRSVAFFHDGNYDARIQCLPTCTGPDNPPKYEPVTAGEHLMAKLLGPRTLQPSAITLDTSAERRS